MVRETRTVTPGELTPGEAAEMQRLMAGYHESSRRLDALEEERAELQRKWAVLSGELDSLREAEDALKAAIGERLGAEVTLAVPG